MEGTWLAVIGLAAGGLGGMLGIGGSTVMIPAMTELMGPQQHLFQSAALIVNFFVAVPSVLQHIRAKAIHGALVVRLVPAAAVASVGGVLCSELPAFRGGQAVYLSALFGIFLFFVAAQEFLRLIRRRRSSQDAVEWRDDGRVWRATLLVGIPAGFVSGLLGVGGGVVAVPLQRRILRVPIRNAIANSAAMIIALSLVGAPVKLLALVRNHPQYEWGDPVRLAALLIPTAILGAWIGSRLTHTLPIRAVRAAFAALLVVAGVRMVLRAAG